ncbi:MAG: ComEC family competence protein, partial [Chitinophagaceae bacterium]
MLFLRLLGAFVTGLIVSIQLPAVSALYLKIGLAGFLCILLVVDHVNFIPTKRKSTIQSVIIYLLFFTLGGYLMISEDQLRKGEHFSKYNYDSLIIRIINEPEAKGKVVQFHAKVLAAYSETVVYDEVIGQIAVSVIPGERQTDLCYGDEFIISAQARAIEGPKNPGEFNYKRWLASKNIHHSLFVKIEQIELLDRKKGNPIQHHAYMVRKKLIDKYQKLIRDGEALSVASTLVLGYRSALSAETISAFSRTGTIHTLSVSGAHVAIVYFFLHHLLIIFERHYWSKVIKLLIIVLLLWGYALITGFSPSVLRAVIMITLIVIGKSFNKDQNSY